MIKLEKHMGKYDFDEVVNRWGSGCEKYDGIARDLGRTDLKPFWVADMDFRTPDFILEALRRRLDHPVFGYPRTAKEYWPTVAAWVKRIHGWEVPPEEMAFVPGIVKGIGFVLDCFCRPGDKVVIQSPVYHPFRIVPEGHALEVVWNPLLPVEEDGVLQGYRMDLDGLERLLDDKVKVLILSNPQNPAGICWDPETLRRLAEITAPRGVIVISDEIHSEMVLDGSPHHPYASVSAQAASNAITFMAPSKTFNIAGIVSSYVIIRDPALRKRFFGFLEADEIDYPPIFSAVATMAAYTPEGDAWRREMLAYVRDNVDFVDRYLKENIPQVRCLKPQASFLVWLDCRALGLPQQDLVSLFMDKAHLLLNDGAMFGPGGAGFMRLNVGCPRSLLADALESLQKALEG